MGECDSISKLSRSKHALKPAVIAKKPKMLAASHPIHPTHLLTRNFVISNAITTLSVRLVVMSLVALIFAMNTIIIDMERLKNFNSFVVVVSMVSPSVMDQNHTQTTTNSPGHQSMDIRKRARSNQ